MKTTQLLNFRCSIVAKRIAIALSVILFLVNSNSAWAYGPLNHLCVANQNWKVSWTLIHAVDPKTSESAARQAFFAGAMADDLGYYPVPGAKDLKLLTDAMHYARTGDWVAQQLQDSAAAPNGVIFAFGLGELSHYAADRMGHYYGTNAVAVQVVKRQSMYGPRMSYERDEPMHFAVETGFDFVAVNNGCSPDDIEEIARNLPRGRAWEAAGHVVDFLNMEYQKTFLSKRLELKEEFFVQALLIADYLFARTALGAEEDLYHIQPSNSALPSLVKEIEASPSNEGASRFSDWAGERVRDGLQFLKDYGQPTIATFEDSFWRANDLYTSLLSEVQASEGSVPSNLSGISFRNINLDTNMESASGQYSLADQTYEHILSLQGVGGKISCPPRNAGAPFQLYFTQGHSDRHLLQKLVWNLSGPDLKDALRDISTFLKQAHKTTSKDPILLPDLDSVTLNRCNPDGICLGQSNARIFLKDANIGIAPGIVNYTAQSTLLNIWLAALAADLLTRPNSSTKVVHDVEDLRLGIFEDYRLDDPASAEGYYGWPDFCVGPPK
jgi:hypothetical protein